MKEKNSLKTEDHIITVCKKCYQALHEEASKTFFYFVGALGIEFDTPLNEETKTLEDTIETMHSYWKTYVVEPDYDIIEFEKYTANLRVYKFEQLVRDTKLEILTIIKENFKKEYLEIPKFS